MEPPATAPTAAAKATSAGGSPPPVASHAAIPSSASTQAVDDIIQRYDALHFSITNTQVLAAMHMHVSRVAVDKAPGWPRSGGLR
eukprot:782340-Pelagomonas_calceolata.AAC.6